MSGRLTIPLDIRLMNGVANLLLIVSAAGAVAGTASWLLRHPAWGVGELEVQGDVQHQTPVTLRAAVAPELSRSFLTLDLQAMKQRFTELPWVRDVVIRREWPNKLTVRIDEHQPVAWWGEPQSGWLVNAHGDVFEAHLDEAHEDWPELSGPKSRSHEVYSVYLMLQETLRDADLSLKAVRMSPQAEWSAVLASGAVIALGRGSADEVQARTQAFLRALPEVKQRYGQHLASADLRYPNGFAVRFNNVVTLAVQPKAPVAPAPKH